MNWVRNVALPLAACAGATALGVTMRETVLPVNLVLMYLLLVVSITIRIGRTAGIVSSVLSVVLYDLFLVPPYHSLAVHDAQHVFTFVLILTVAIITSYLAEGIRRQEQLADTRARQTEALREMSAALAGASDLGAVCEVGTSWVAKMFDVTVLVLLAGDDGRLAPCTTGGAAPRLAVGVERIAAAVFNAGARDSATGVYSAGMYYIALRTPGGTGGVLAVTVPQGQNHFHEQSERLIHVAAGQLAMAVERIFMAAIAQKAQTAIDAERFRNSVLAAVSHDLRTPLTALTGLASQLVMSGERRPELETSIQRVTLRMNHMVSNLLDMARFGQGSIALQRDWHLIDEVIGSAIAQQREDGFALPIRSRSTATPRLTLFDAALIERVLWNLIENAKRHASGATGVTIRAGYRCGFLLIFVKDNGCGITSQGGGDGQGLGLAICRAIVDAHGGSLTIKSARPAGTTAAISIPAAPCPEQAQEEAI